MCWRCARSAGGVLWRLRLTWISFFLFPHLLSSQQRTIEDQDFPPSSGEELTPQQLMEAASNWAKRRLRGSEGLVFVHLCEGIAGGREQRESGGRREYCRTKEGVLHPTPVPLQSRTTRCTSQNAALLRLGKRGSVLAWRRSAGCGNLSFSFSFSFSSSFSFSLALTSLSRAGNGFSPEQLQEFSHLITMVSATYIPRSQISSFRGLDQVGSAACASRRVPGG